jgi:hypothetical protein
VSLRERYYIKQVGYREAMNMVVEYHYLHRKAPCSFSFGLFEKETDKMVGVVCYGTPSSYSLRQGLCGKDEKDNVIELTRLFIFDNTPKNVESFLIGNTLNKVDKEIVVSYAEAEQGHIGYVYQATNFIYTGLSAKRGNYTIEGSNLHSQTIGDKYKTVKELKRVFGDKFSYQPRPRKHRYIYFNCDKRRKKELLSKLRYKIEPYPKKPQ